MKIAFITTDIIEPGPTRSFSLSIWIYNVASRLAQYHDVVVYSPRGDYQEEVEYFHGVKYRRISTTFDRWLGYLIQGACKRFPIFDQTRQKRPYFTSIFYNLIYILSVAKDLKTEKYDIAYIHEVSAFISIIRTLNPQIRIVLHMHGELLTQLDHSMVEHRLSKADLILSCSRYLTGKIQKSFPSVARRCRTLYNGVDIASFINNSKNDDKKLAFKKLLFVSRISPEKGLHVLLEAFKEVVEKYPQIHLDVVGYLQDHAAADVEAIVLLNENCRVQKLASFYKKGSLKSYLDHLSHKLISLNISNNVTFYGLIPHDQVIKFYQAADIFVLPSFSEAFGIGFVEAMACQVPVVGTSVGGIPEIVEDGKTGLLVTPGDNHALANAILKLLPNEDLRKEMRRIGRKRVVSFSWDNIVTNLLSLLGDMVKHRKLEIES